MCAALRRIGIWAAGGRQLTRTLDSGKKVMGGTFRSFSSLMQSLATASLFTTTESMSLASSTASAMLYFLDVALASSVTRPCTPAWQCEIRFNDALCTGFYTQTQLGHCCDPPTRPAAQQQHINTSQQMTLYQKVQHPQVHTLGAAGDMDATASTAGCTHLETAPSSCAAPRSWRARARPPGGPPWPPSAFPPPPPACSSETPATPCHGTESPCTRSM